MPRLPRVGLSVLLLVLLIVAVVSMGVGAASISLDELITTLTGISLSDYLIVTTKRVLLPRYSSSSTRYLDNEL